MLQEYFSSERCLQFESILKITTFAMSASRSTQPASKREGAAWAGEMLTKKQEKMTYPDGKDRTTKMETHSLKKKMAEGNLDVDIKVKLVLRKSN